LSSIKGFIKVGKIKRVIGKILKPNSTIGVIPKVNVKAEFYNISIGEIVNSQEMHNLAVLDGRNLIRDFLNGDAVTSLSDFVIGTGSKEVEYSDSALENEVFRGQITKRIKDNAKLTLYYYLSSIDANGKELSEVGLVNQDNVLYARVLLNETIQKNENIAGTLTWELTWDSI